MIRRRKPLRRTALKRSTKPIRRVSAKRRRENAIYSALRKGFLEEHLVCQMAAPGCTGQAQEVHHKAGRGKNLNNVATWAAICSHCHRETHQHPSIARKNGFLV